MVIYLKNNSKSSFRSWWSLSWSVHSSPFLEPEVRCRIQKSPPLDPILSQMHPVHTLTPYLRG